MKKRRAIRLIGLGIMLSQPMSYVLDATIVKAVEDAPSDTVSLPTRISIKAGQPSAQVQKVKDDSTMAQGMPTGCRVWNPLVWLINLFRI